jgi:acetylornithine deacetylase/succinyl-diaminopimelate desuccinylase-like protein
MRMVARGEPGHGSMPHDDNAVLHLSQALDRLRRAKRLPIHLTPTVRGTLDALAKQAGFPLSAVVGLMRYPTLAGIMLERLPPEAKQVFSSMLSNSVSPNILKAGAKTNVIPSLAEAQIDCRLLPGQTPEDAMREILAITGDRVILEPINTSDGAAFSTDTPLYRYLETAARKLDPQGIVLPLMVPGATDATAYKHAGITVYGFTPGVIPEGFPLLKLIHGHDERFPISSIRSGLPVLWDVVSEFCCNTS